MAANDLPYVINPEKGFIVSANNPMTSAHRAVRISELLESLIASDKPIRVREI